MGAQVQGVFGIELLGQGRRKTRQLGGGLGLWCHLTSFVPVNYGNLVIRTRILMDLLNIICYIPDVYIILKGRLNTWSHGLGVVLALVGSLVLLQRDPGNIPYLTGSLWAYCLSLILLFSASTIYHGTVDPKLRKKLRIVDHISIYYLIAGTYTPVCLTLLLESKGWSLFYLVWGIALFGTLLKIFFTGRFEVFSVALYGVMGWLIVIDLPHLLDVLSAEGILYFALGGGSYT